MNFTQAKPSVAVQGAQAWLCRSQTATGGLGAARGAADSVRDASSKPVLVSASEASDASERLRLEAAADGALPVRGWGRVGGVAIGWRTFGEGGGTGGGGKGMTGGGWA